MIPVFRFSCDGFASKVQQHHYRLLQQWHEPEDYSGLNEYQIKIQKKAYEEAKPFLERLNLDDWKEGVFVFVGSLPEPHWINHELNHLKSQERLNRRLYVGRIDLHAEVYSVYGLIPEIYTVEKYLSRYFSGAAAFIPKRSLSLIREISDE